MPTFLCDEDYVTYTDLTAEWCEERGVEVWAAFAVHQCARLALAGDARYAARPGLMPNHVHLVCVPATEQSLRLGIGEAHRRYSRHVNFREGWRGHLWQSRFASFPMDDTHLYAATRYVELNPVRAKLVSDPTEYRWSSARAHMKGQDDELVKVQPLLDRFGEWSELLASGLSKEGGEVIRSHERTGRPLGPPAFVDRLERLLRRTLKPQRRGPKPKPQRTNKRRQNGAGT